MSMKSAEDNKTTNVELSKSKKVENKPGESKIEC